MTARDRFAVWFAAFAAAVVGVTVILIAHRLLFPGISIYAPIWVIDTIGGGCLCFSCGAFLSTTAVSRWIIHAFGSASLSTFAIAGIWVGLGPGERQFVSTAQILLHSIGISTSPFVGRALFAISGGFIAVWACASWYRVVMSVLGSVRNKP